eukprot:1943274-Heterocapsa_arctica.AAC.1
MCLRKCGTEHPMVMKGLHPSTAWTQLDWPMTSLVLTALALIHAAAETTVCLEPCRMLRIAMASEMLLASC